MNGAGFGTDADGSLGATVAIMAFLLGDSVSMPRPEASSARRGIVRGPDNSDVQDVPPRRGNR